MSLENKLQDKTKKKINRKKKWYSVGKMTFLIKLVFYQKHLNLFGTWILFEKVHWVLLKYKNNTGHVGMKC